MIITDNRSVYDSDTHTPYPTINFILSQTGENMTNLAGTELRANAEIRQLTDEFKRYLQMNKLRETFNYMEYLIATKQEWRFDFVKAVASAIYNEYNSNETRSEIFKKIIDGSSLISIERFRGIKQFEMHRGY